METAVHPGAVQAEAAVQAEETALPPVPRMRPAVELTEDQFFELCRINRELRIERSAAGDLLLMTPAGGGTGAREAEITRQVAKWAKGDGTGTAFSPSAGFTLPNGAVRAPDASWMPRSRLDHISAEAWEKSIPACRAFVLELRSPSDRLVDV